MEGGGPASAVRCLITNTTPCGLAPAKHRGRLVLTFQVGIGVGILISTVIGAASSLSWRLDIGIAAAARYTPVVDLG